MKQFFILNYFSFLPKAQYSYFFSHLCDIEELFFIISENYWRIKKESVLNTTSSKKKVFHWHVPHLQQKALKDGEKGKQPVKPSCTG